MFVQLGSSCPTLAPSRSCCYGVRLWSFVNVSWNGTMLAYLESLVGCLLILWNQILALIFGPRQDEWHTLFVWLAPCGVKSSCTLHTLLCVFHLWLVPSGWICTLEPLASLLEALLLVHCKFLNILSANQQFIYVLLPSLCTFPLSLFWYVISSWPLYIFKINTKKAAKASLWIGPCPLACITLHIPGHFVGHLEKTSIFLL